MEYEVFSSCGVNVRHFMDTDVLEAYENYFPRRGETTTHKIYYMRWTNQDFMEKFCLEFLGGGFLRDVIDVHPLAMCEFPLLLYRVLVLYPKFGWQKLSRLFEVCLLFGYAGVLKMIIQTLKLPRGIVYDEVTTLDKIMWPEKLVVIVGWGVEDDEVDWSPISVFRSKKEDLSIAPIINGLRKFAGAIKKCWRWPPHIKG